ncbi:hypothetical protein CBJ89_001965 [Salmonella enterica subsp. enterica serovar Essen]|nr:hypothetical protein [Salmonella enterica subsp. enterica serovar Aba]EBZ0012551.1 hypothetical protein [Salmonella enterica subsp. enterica serovar Suberu]ECG5317604.1 hypothetical protein [Salmonella enterica subsp. enterica serovar Aba]ECI7956921.1 hypothetical protein [Salmonella enterica subsp. enterica]EDU3844924.1 hypothetical protein [Salmonella enterica subsp. enterica serovar Essen]
MKELLLAFIPRFINDQIALNECEGKYEIMCSMIDVHPSQKYDAMCDLKIFTWFGWAIPCGEPANIRPFVAKEEA